MHTSGLDRGDGFDPADQWVRNPHTGEYELRPTPPAGRPEVPGPRSAPDGAGESRGPGPRRTAGRAGSRAGGRARRGTGKKAGRKSLGKRVLLWTSGTLAFVADLTGLPAAALEPGRSETNDQGLPAIALRLGADFRGAGIPSHGRPGQVRLVG